MIINILDVKFLIDNYSLKYITRSVRNVLDFYELRSISTKGVATQADPWEYQCKGYISTFCSVLSVNSIRYRRISTSIQDDRIPENEK